MNCKSIIRRVLFSAFASATISCMAAAPVDAAAALKANAVTASASKKLPNSDLAWYDGALLTLEGHAFNDTATSYSRLPARYKNKVTSGVWYAGRSAAGLALHFISDSPEINAYWDAPNPPMGHMAWSGSGGMDLYERMGDKWVFRGIGKPTSTTGTLAEVKRLGKGTTTPAEYLMFLPTYSMIKKVAIGITPGSHIAPAPAAPADQKPIVFYGTSITQGGCASRAGMCHTSILRRWLDYPVINLGFSGSGKCEPIMAELLAEIPASMYVIETLQNMTLDQINERMVPFVKDLRRRQPATPIVIMESPNIITQAEKHAALKKAFEKLQADNVPDIYYHRGDHMYDTLEEPTVDGTHPTDLGFYQMARDYRPLLEQLLQKTAAPKAQ